jgi:hypothetical protein
LIFASLELAFFFKNRRGLTLSLFDWQLRFCRAIGWQVANV